MEWSGGQRGPTKQQSAHAQQQHQLRQQQDKSGSRESSKEKEVDGEDDGEVGKNHLHVTGTVRGGMIIKWVACLTIKRTRQGRGEAMGTADKGGCQ